MVSRVMIPKCESTASTDGNSNRMPITNTIAMKMEIYEVRAKVFSTLPLT